MRIQDELRGYRSNVWPDFISWPDSQLFPRWRGAAILKNHSGEHDIYASSGGLLLHDRLFIKPFTIINNLCRSLPLQGENSPTPRNTCAKPPLAWREEKKREGREKGREPKRERERENRGVTNTYLSKPNDATDARNPATRYETLAVHRGTYWKFHVVRNPPTVRLNTVEGNDY